MLISYSWSLVSGPAFWLSDSRYESTCTSCKVSYDSWAELVGVTFTWQISKFWSLIPAMTQPMTHSVNYDS